MCFPKTPIRIPAKSGKRIIRIEMVMIYIFSISGLKFEFFKNTFKYNHYNSKTQNILVRY